MKFAYAKWTLNELPEEIGDIHISAGEDDESQENGYFPTDEGAKLTIENKTGNYHVLLICPSLGLENSEDYWLSPNLPDGMSEADYYGIGTLKEIEEMP